MKSEAVRVLIVPGINDSGPGHWQTLLQTALRGAVRVAQDDWTAPSLERWAQAISRTLAREKPGPWVAVAHSFGCLALVRWLLAGQDVTTGSTRVHSALLVAPADPARFGASDRLAGAALGIPTTLVASRNDPWMSFETAAAWSREWGSALVDAGAVGHINVASGHGPWPRARWFVERQIQALHSQRRIERAHPSELSFAI